MQAFEEITILRIDLARHGCDRIGQGCIPKDNVSAHRLRPALRDTAEKNRWQLGPRKKVAAQAEKKGAAWLRRKAVIRADEKGRNSG
jgi:hypothetical protein